MSVYKRQINILKSNSFFLFGARGTGKTALLRQDFVNRETCLWLDLLDAKREAELSENPGRLLEWIKASPGTEWVVIDEVQKVPRILDVVHLAIESMSVKFALTGSSARKLKRGGANLLAGRALVNYLFPLTHLELGDDFRLATALAFGTLPTVATSTDELIRIEYLESYVQTYLKEELLQEQIIRNLVPFRKFLGIAAQSNGTLLNYQNIANDIGVDWATIRNYFEILEDTMMGFQIPAFDRSLRKQQLQSGKFYFFDVGVKRTLDRTITLPPETGQQIGPLFEHFLIAEIYRLNHYLRRRFTLSHLATKGGLEIDLVIERPGQSTVLVEIKSTDRVTDKHLKHLHALHQDFPEFTPVCLCQETLPRNVDGVYVLPWQQGLKELGVA